LLVVFSFGCLSEKEYIKPPNIILILADDMGYSDLGCFGSEIITPNLDRLAYDGLRMTNFYNSAKCCPSRAALMTGLYPHQAGMGDMVEGRLLPDSTALPAYQGYLNQNCVTLAEVLGQHGYHTVISGKWHLGDTAPYWPHERGFEKVFSLIHGMSNYFNLDPWLRPDQEITLMDGNQEFKAGEDFYMTRAFSDRAIEFLEDRPKDKPFFLYLAYTAPHYPLHALPEDIEMFRGTYLEGWDSIRNKRFQKMKQLGIVADEYLLPPKYQAGELTPEWDSLTAAEKEQFDLRMATHAAMIYRMDQGIGRVVNALKEQHELDNTLIMFMSDNGAAPAALYRSKYFIAETSGEIGTEQSFDSQGPAWANVSNTPLRLFKRYTAEGGINSPFIAHWPAGIKAGQVVGTPGHVIDIMPTVLEISGSTYPQSFRKQPIQPLEGTSLLPTFSGNELPVRPLFFEHMGYKAVRQGPWKLVSNQSKNNPQSQWQLFKVDIDPGETTDLSKAHPNKREELVTVYHQWADRVGVYEPYDSLILARRFR